MDDRYLFRAWDKCYNKMIYNGIGRNHKLSIGFDGKIYGFEYDEEKTPDNESEIGEYPERFVIMQCTGLKDKSGVFIWESDIVAYANKMKEGFEIVWHIDGWKRKISCHNGEYYDYLPIHHNSMIVISNIHDNPELLKDGD